MHLVEIIATRTTDAGSTLDALETWLTSRLGKGVVRALDTPNFVANRVGVFSILAVMHHTQRLRPRFRCRRRLTGPKIGRPKSATYRTADVVGLDTLAHVVKTMQDTLPDDPVARLFHAGAGLAGTALIAQGRARPEDPGGIFRKRQGNPGARPGLRRIPRPSAGEIAAEVLAILKNKRPGREVLPQLRASSHPQAQFLWAIFRDIFHYAAVHLESIADNARDLDSPCAGASAGRRGRSRTWQAAGWAIARPSPPTSPPARR
jgi:3-hydroxyacyl-CoA dehydrogenase